MRGLVVISLVFAAAVPVAAQAPYELAVDVPSKLGSVTYAPSQVVRHVGASYSAVISLPATVAIGALHRRSNGTILFAPSHAVVLGGAAYEPRDIVAYNGTTYSFHLDGSVAGIPANARIDAIYVDDQPGTIMSFDIPVQLGGVWRNRSSLERWSGSAWSEVWSAAAAGVPPAANVVGADRTPAGELVVAFDIPLTIGSTLYKPGDLVGWNGTSFHSVASDVAWPASSELRDFSFLPEAGTVPETGAAPLRVSKLGSAVTLSWGASCSVLDTDYEIYEGSMTSGYSNHIPNRCSTGGATSASFVPGGGSRYFLVVPRNVISEGYYGDGASGAERAVSLGACLPHVVGVCGP